MTDTHLVIDIHRHFAAPRGVVYQAFTDEDQVAAWFGPNGALVLREAVSVDARVGGHRHVKVISSNGLMSWAINTTFTDVSKNELLVGDVSVTGFPGFHVAETVVSRLEFIDEGDGTRLELREGPYSLVTEAIAREFWLQSFTRLDALLAG